jgi:hypothetical protein
VFNQVSPRGRKRGTLELELLKKLVSTWKFIHIKNLVIRSQCRREVPMELYVFDRQVQTIDSFIDIHPTPLYQEGKDVRCL